MTSPNAVTSDALARRIARAEARVAAVETRGRRYDTVSAGGPIAWRIWGGGEPILLLHGGSGSWTHWIANIPALSERHRVVAPDLPGMGDSAAPLDESADSVADALNAGLDHIVGPGAPFHLAGFSFGCVIAGHLSARAGGRVHSLMLIGPVGLGVTRNGPANLHRIKQGTPIGERWDLQRANLATQMLADVSRIDDLAIYIHDRNVTRARLRSSRLSRRETLGPTLKDLDIPVAMLWGSRDSVYGADTGERVAFAEKLSRAAPAQFVPDAGHWAAYEKPHVVNAAIKDWLAHGQLQMEGSQ